MKEAAPVDMKEAAMVITNTNNMRTWADFALPLWLCGTYIQPGERDVCLYFFILDVNTVQHAKFIRWNFCKFEVRGIFTTCNFHVLEILHIQMFMPVFFREDCLSDCEVMMV